MGQFFLNMSGFTLPPPPPLGYATGPGYSKRASKIHPHDKKNFILHPKKHKSTNKLIHFTCLKNVISSWISDFINTPKIFPTAIVNHILVISLDILRPWSKKRNKDFYLKNFHKPCEYDKEARESHYECPLFFYEKRP